MRLSDEAEEAEVEFGVGVLNLRHEGIEVNVRASSVVVHVSL